MTITTFPQIVFGLALPATEPERAIPADLARELVARIAAAAVEMENEVPAARAAELRREAERYLGARRGGGLRLPFASQRACDEGARTLLRLTVSTPPVPFGAAPQLLVA